MKFEEFEKAIWERGYGIAAMNHYTIQGEKYTYCVVISRNCERAFKSGKNSSCEGFKSIVDQIDNYNNNKS